MLEHLPTSKLLIPASNWNGLLIVGDCPYNADAVQAPFMMSHAGTLTTLMKSFTGYPALANVSSSWVPYRRFANLTQSVMDLELSQLNEVIDFLQPKLILFLGRETARVVAGITDLDSYRGAPFKYKGKYLSTFSYHPAETFQSYELTIILRHDLARVLNWLTFGWQAKPMDIVATPDFKTVIDRLHELIDPNKLVIADIETREGANDTIAITCVGFSDSDSRAFCVPFEVPNGRYWAAHEEPVVWKLMARVLETAKLAGHNAVHYDHYVLSRFYRIIPNFVHDTMLLQYEIACELPKSLAFVNSLYLQNEYWKFSLKDARSGKAHYTEEFVYNCKDCIVNSQALVEMLPQVSGARLAHYNFNIRISRAFQYMALGGMKFDVAKRDARLRTLQAEADSMTVELHDLAKVKLNVRSPKQMKEWLYGTLKLPPKFKVKKNEDGEREKVETADYLSLLWLAYEFPHIKALMVAGRLRKTLKRISTLTGIKPRPNGYVGYSFNCVGTVTGRASASLPPDGLGIQPQNQDRRDRDLYICEPHEFLMKADLEGADSWTVAACLQSVGDSTMMDDLLAGLKPAQAIGIIFTQGKHLVRASAKELKAFMPAFKTRIAEDKKHRGPGRTIYDVMKAVSHGGNYGMAAATEQANIFKKTDGELYVPLSECEELNKIYLQRYVGILKWHTKLTGILSTHGYLDCFSGQRREFFGRRSADTVREMASMLPQNNTGYVTNCTISNLYYRRYNRRVNDMTKFVMRLVNQVHDETVCRFDRDDLDLARRIFALASANEVETWGVKFSIPFEANYGLTWGDCTETL